MSFESRDDSCKDCVSEYRHSSCPAVEMTAQCTDQCLVIACHDLTHDEVPCLEPACDMVCDGVADCTDCTGYQDMLCCTDNHPYYSPQSSPTTDLTSSAMPWDSFSCDFLCDCIDSDTSRNSDGFLGELPTVSHQNNDTSIRSPDPMSDNYTISSEMQPFYNDSHPVLVPRESSQYPIPPQSPSRAHHLSCLWGNCHESFSSPQELASHVNYVHLRSFSTSQLNTSTGEPFRVQTHPHDNATFDISCQWADCDQYLSPSSVPGPSTGNLRNAALGVITHHLFQDHLGIPADPPPPSGVKVIAEGSKGEIISDSIPTPPVSPPPPLTESQPVLQHDCSGAHACHWQSCTAVFPSCDELTVHITTLHVGAGKAHYECLWKDCNRHGDRGFSSKQKICRHLQSHTGHRPFQCEKCQQYFSEAATLQQHMRRHTQEKPYPCDFPGCGKAFAIMGALTIHRRKHNGHKPFKCKYCDRAFAESSNLSKHLRTHTGDRPYSCSVEGCGKSFARPDQLTRHMGVHKKKSNLAPGGMIISLGVEG